MTRLFRSLCDVFLRFIRARAGESLVRRAMLEQAGVAAVKSVRVPPGASRCRHLLVRIRIAEGCDAREVSRAAVQTLFRTPLVTEVRLVEPAGDRPAFEP